jgi:hypothetical protein
MMAKMGAWPSDIACKPPQKLGKKRAKKLKVIVNSEVSLKRGARFPLATRPLAREIFINGLGRVAYRFSKAVVD